MKYEIGYIYILKSLDLYKIGKSKDGEQRIKGYKTYNPHGIEVVLIARVKFYEHLEKKIHKIFDKKRITGEWFRLDKKDVVETKKVIFPELMSCVDKYNYGK